MALSDALTERGGVWFGWSGETLERETRGVRLFAEGNVDFALADLTQAEYDGYYLGYANRALWPVFHYRVDLAHFDEADFAAYEQVNRRFARLLAQFTQDDDTVWVHDYHLLLMGQELRASGWQGRMGFFLHIPFPAPEVFTALPQHQRLARGLCAFDLVGFQTNRDTANFIRYLVELAGGIELDDGRIQVFDQTLRAATFSIGIDPDDIAALAGGEEGRAAAARLGRIIDNRALVIGVDRMDYSKGLPQRMEAFGRMLDDHEDLRGSVSFLQIAPPSREAVDAYQVLREELDRIVGRINADYADLDWMPIRYLARGYSRDALCGLYRLARVGLVTPLHDGMNLVAKEFVAAQDFDDPGRAGALGVRRRRRTAQCGAPGQSPRHRRHRGRDLPRALDAGRGASRALAGAEPCGSRTGHRLVAAQLPGSAGRQPGQRVTLGDLQALHLALDDALYLDFDGTLAEIGPDPDAIVLPTRHHRRPRSAGGAAGWRRRDPQRPRSPRPRLPHAADGLARRRPRPGGPAAGRHPASPLAPPPEVVLAPLRAAARTPACGWS